MMPQFRRTIRTWRLQHGMLEELGAPVESVLPEMADEVVSEYLAPFRGTNRGAPGQVRRDAGVADPRLAGHLASISGSR